MYIDYGSVIGAGEVSDGIIYGGRQYDDDDVDKDNRDEDECEGVGKSKCYGAGEDDYV